MKGKQMMKVAVFATMATVGFASGPAWAAGRPTADQAVAMVKKAVTFCKENGKQKCFAAIDDQNGQFRDGTLYLVVQGTDGRCLAHGANRKLVGLNLIGAKDVDGKEFVRDMIAAAKAKNGTWTDYKFTNPITRKVEPKSMYCEHLDGSDLVCGGVFKG